MHEQTSDHTHDRIVDVTFSIHGSIIPIDHNYYVYAALSNAIPDFHSHNFLLRFAPIACQHYAERLGIIRDSGGTSLHLRVPLTHIVPTVKMAFTKLNLGGYSIRLGSPSVTALRPAERLMARIVTFKGAMEPAHVLGIAKRRLSGLGINGVATIPTVTGGPHDGELRRQIVRIKSAAIVGYELLVTGLTEYDSVRLQAIGLGGRQRIGCGFFLPHAAAQRAGDLAASGAVSS